MSEAIQAECKPGKADNPGLIAGMRRFLGMIAIRLFVDSVWLHKYWGCHRLSDRCFFVQGRQFHICARCTGLFVGLPCSVLLLPVRQELPFIFCAFALVLAIDGFTQRARWRISNNKLRFVTGFGTAVTFLPSLLTIAGHA